MHHLRFVLKILVIILRYLFLTLKFLLPVVATVVTWNVYKMEHENHEHVHVQKSQEKSQDDLNKILIDLMQKAKGHVSEIDPIISFVHQKLESYRKQRKYDKMEIVGSIGNKLYFPEKLSDGSYQLELDVMYYREMPNVPLPTSYGSDENVPIAHLVPEMRVLTIEMHSPESDQMANEENTSTISSSKSYSYLLRVDEIKGEITEYDKTTFITTKENDNTYLYSNAYMAAIPLKFENTILGEREVETVLAPLLLPLYRTFRTQNLTLTSEESNFTFSVIMDKVAAIKAPWPTEAAEFQTRDRKWPSKEIIDSIIDDGCLLIHKPTSNSETYHTEWKITFSLSEQRLAFQFSFYQRFLFILLKLIKRKFLDVGTFESGESRSGLTTFHMKSIYLWLCENIDETTWSESPVSCFKMFFEKLKECIETEVCPHFFMPDVNIMYGIWGYKRLTLGESNDLEQNEPIKTVMLRKIEDILKQPEKVLTEELFNTLDEKHVVERQKEIRYTNPYTEFLETILHQSEEGSETLDFLRAIAEKISDEN